MNKQLFSSGLGNFRPHRMLYSIDTASLAKTYEQILSPFGDSFGPMEPHIRQGCTLEPPGQYDWSNRARRQCGLMSNYFGHSLGLHASYRLCFKIKWLIRSLICHVRGVPKMPHIGVSFHNHLEFWGLNFYSNTAVLIRTLYSFHPWSFIFQILIKF